MIDAYLNQAIGMLEAIQLEEKENIREAGQIIAKKIEAGGIVHLFGCGHSHILTEEVFYRAGGLAPIHPILHEPLMLHEGAAQSSVLERKNHYAEHFMAKEDIRAEDVMIVLSTSGRNPVPIDVALFAKQKGAYVIGITSKAYSGTQASRHVSGQKLSDIPDLVIDNKAVKGDAVLRLENFDVPFAATSTVTGAAILQSLFAEAISAMYQAGFTPPVFLSGNTENADDYNQALLAKYQARIPLLTLNLEK
ncbi:SIS domain-containing protein [Listeria kieliensis]|uniref:UPF0309 protein UR08_03510 n=1 Tax=Listeria kieliensis TaxID=1621700 RepID=A0A3D8TU18_9LIST|nr:SIS domain-containing protein [Listeria kieliensis]RDX02586.1 hypothetical protein UR08_03510 [Listeria kieliensis]